MIRKTRKITLKDVAERAKVSVAAASMALADHPQISPETKDRVLRLSRKLGYTARRELRPPGAKAGAAAGTRFAFLLIGGRLEDEAYSGMLHALLVNSSASKVRMEVSAIEETTDQKAVIDRVMQHAHEVQGLILMGEVTHDLIVQLQRTKMPHTVLGYAMAEPGELSDTNVQMIATDEIGMGRLATTKLLESGHKRIGFVCEEMKPGLIFERWLTGWAMAHLIAGMSPDRSLVHVANQRHVGGGPAAEAFGAMKDPPTAYVIPDARTAASFLQAMRDRGREVPRDSIVMGGQDFVMKRYAIEEYPQVLENLEKMAGVALEHLQRLVAQPATHAAEILVPFTAKNLP
jgi:LacI family transcriptional regulator